MKKIEMIIAAALLTAGCAGGTSAVSEDDFVCIPDKLQDRTIVEYADALNEFAGLTPFLCDDTESYWAAAQCDSIAKALKEEKDRPFVERMSGIYLMQTYCGYSLTYVPGCMMRAADKNSPLCDALPLVSDTWKSYDEIAGENFSDYQKILHLGEKSYLHIQLFRQLCGALSIIPDVKTDASGFRKRFDDSGLMTDSLFVLNVPRERIFRIANVLETIYFFQTFSPLLLAFAPEGEDHYNEACSVIEEFVQFFEPYMDEVYSSFEKNPSETTAPEGKAFEKFMEKSLYHKTRTLRLLSRDIRILENIDK